MGPGEFIPQKKIEPTFDEEKKEMILKTLDENGGSVNKTSVKLGIKASSIRRMLAEWRASETQPKISSYKNSTRQFYENIRSPWRVVSLDSMSRRACIEIRNRTSTVNLDYTLPNYR